VPLAAGSLMAAWDLARAAQQAAQVSICAALLGWCLMQEAQAGHASLPVHSDGMRVPSALPRNKHPPSSTFH